MLKVACTIVARNTKSQHRIPLEASWEAKLWRGGRRGDEKEVLILLGQGLLPCKYPGLQDGK